MEYRANEFVRRMLYRPRLLDNVVYIPSCLANLLSTNVSLNNANCAVTAILFTAVGELKLRTKKNGGKLKRRSPVKMILRRPYHVKYLISVDIYNKIIKKYILA
jgi:hypothetical protein